MLNEQTLFAELANETARAQELVLKRELRGLDEKQVKEFVCLVKWMCVDLWEVAVAAEDAVAEAELALSLLIAECNVSASAVAMMRSRCGEAHDALFAARRQMKKANAFYRVVRHVGRIADL